MHVCVLYFVSVALPFACTQLNGCRECVRPYWWIYEMLFVSCALTQCLDAYSERTASSFVLLAVPCGSSLCLVCHYMFPHIDFTFVDAVLAHLPHSLPNWFFIIIRLPVLSSLSASSLCCSNVNITTNIRGMSPIVKKCIYTSVWLAIGNSVVI